MELRKFSRDQRTTKKALRRHLSWVPHVGTFFVLPYNCFFSKKLWWNKRRSNLLCSQNQRTFHYLLPIFVSSHFIFALLHNPLERRVQGRRAHCTWGELLLFLKFVTFCLLKMVSSHVKVQEQGVLSCSSKPLMKGTLAKGTSFLKLPIFPVWQGYKDTNRKVETAICTNSRIRASDIGPLPVQQFHQWVRYPKVSILKQESKSARWR